MKKHLLPASLALVLLLSACATNQDPSADTAAPAGSTPPTDTVPSDSADSTVSTPADTTPETDPTRNLRKLCFYIGTGTEYMVIDSLSELTAAVSEAVRETAELTLTVRLVSNIESTPEYIALSTEREHLQTLEEVRAWRERLNAYSESYHKKIADDSAALIASLGYERVEFSDLSPFVLITLPPEELTAEHLLALANADTVASVSVMPDAGDPVPE